VVAVPAADVPVSVVVRTRDKLGTLPGTLASIRRQTVGCEVIVVDSGSTDGTLDYARSHADQLLTMEPGEFSFGRALNLGAEAARAPVVAAVSAHAVLPHEAWLRVALEHLGRDAVAGTSGRWNRPGEAVPLEEPFVQTAGRWAGGWGFSNTASAWRRDVWLIHPFDEGMRACEDLEWSWRVLQAGWRIVIDPRLAVSGEHRRQTGLLTLFRREALEREELCRSTPTPPITARQAASEWWRYMPANSRWPPAIRRLSPHRITEYSGRWLGGRRARRRAGPRPRGDVQTGP
jgi:rhamnosyltransferase